jgi:hypothetical protein
MPGLSFTGLGKRPDLTPSHHVDFETGIKVRMVLSRTNPVSGIRGLAITMVSFKVLGNPS